MLGCAHAGIVNILNHAVDRTGENRIYAVLGGTHLGLSLSPQFDPTIRALQEFDIQMLAVAIARARALWRGSRPNLATSPPSGVWISCSRFNEDFIK